MAGRTLAIGDIHGCDTALETLLRALAPTPADTLVVLGDIVDRGPDSRRAIELLLEYRERCRLVLILGNHEEMMLEALVVAVDTWTDDWLRFGGAATLSSYGGADADVPPAHLEFLDSGLDYFETDTELFVHANLEPGVPLDEQSPEWLRWTHLSGHERPHSSGKRVICGHTPQKEGVPVVLPGWVGIDTFVWGGGWLTALDVGSNEYLQTNQGGEIRQGKLPAVGS
ncbi:MAG: metallophosphoesterase family protein [Planctomycetaceae bacterium]